MLRAKLSTPRGNVRKWCWQRFFLPFIFMALIVPAWGDDKSKDEETLKNATKVLSDMLSSDKVPADVLARANCVIVLPSVKKFGFGIGGSGGRGPMTCRGGKNFSGKWSAPAMYTIGGASVGLQVGGSSTDYVLFIMSQRGLEAMLKGKTKLGNEATAAAGPSGATNAGTVGGTDVLTYARASGLFAGTSLGGATLQADNDANQRLYDKAVNADEIVLQNAVKPTVGGQSLVSLLNTKVTKHQG
ncbi:MAG TPA: lipid-binding SYLF domain-containing protein [Candidatus Acidoferrum sp.]|jgi:lipid-binding SYLF domain-containing protein